MGLFACSLLILELHQCTLGSATLLTSLIFGDLLYLFGFSLFNTNLVIVERQVIQFFHRRFGVP